MLGHKASLKNLRRLTLYQAWDSCSSRKEREKARETKARKVVLQSREGPQEIGTKISFGVGLKS